MFEPASPRLGVACVLSGRIRGYLEQADQASIPLHIEFASQAYLPLEAIGPEDHRNATLLVSCLIAHSATSNPRLAHWKLEVEVWRTL